MKTWLPHCFYFLLLLSGGSYIWWTENIENQLVRHLNRPMQMAYGILHPGNQQLKKVIERFAETYPFEKSVDYAHRARVVDSLASIPLSNDYNLDSLRAGLATQLQEYSSDKDMKKRLMWILPPREKPVLWETSRFFRSQNDSLRQQLVLSHLLNYFFDEMDITNLHGAFDKFSPAASLTTLCSPAGQTSQMDIYLSHYYWPAYEIRVNGQPLLIKDELGKFEHIFSIPGVYPLKVECRTLGYDWPYDSTITSEKTFLLHVNR